MKKKNRFLANIMASILVLSSINGCGAKSSGAAEATRGADPEPYEATAAATAEEYITAAAAEEEYGAVETMAAETTGAYEQGLEMKSEGTANNDMAARYQMAYGGDHLNSEEYHQVVETGFQDVVKQPLSTFSVDVDTASYGNIRRMINQGQEIPPDAVRIEEMINYFQYDYREPKGDDPFSVNAELSDCPWNPDHQLLLVGLQAKEIDMSRRPMSNLVFLLDVSGSMYDDDKLPLVQKSFSMLTEELTENDRISIVTYAGYEQVALEGARGDQKQKIREALESLTAGGSTAGEAGINRAYELAERYYIEGGNNRVILATDGDLNVGVSSETGLISLIEEKRKGGVDLSVLGFGTGNLKDNKMEALADHGDGNYNYIDSLREAKKVLVEEMGGTLVTVAKDVKLQLEFNPVQVAGYRLLGYENRRLRDEDFENDQVDAGEIGAGHRVTALYELIPAGGSKPSLRYQDDQGDGREQKETDKELLTVNIRYKAPNGDKSRLLSVPVEAEIYQTDMTPNLQFASAVAEFGMLLRDSEYKGKASFQAVLDRISRIPKGQMDDYKEEFAQLVRRVSDR